MTRRFLVTGGAGFIGLHLARRLAQDGADVDLLDNLSRGRRDDDLAQFAARPGVRLLEGDLNEPAVLRDLPRGYDAVFHLAAVIGVRNVNERPDRVLATNARTLLNVLDWYVDGGAGRLVFSSTSEVYAWGMTVADVPIPTPEEVPIAFESLQNRRASYAMSKAFGEMAVMHACRRADKAFSIVRYHNVYGPRMGMQHVIPEVFERIHRGDDPLVVYNPHQMRAFCYVDDAVAATIALAVSNVASDVYNVGNAREEVTIGDLVDRMVQVAGRGNARREFRTAGGPGVERRCPDIKRLTAATGFAPRVSLDEGLERTFQWYRQAFERPGGAGA